MAIMQAREQYLQIRKVAIWGAGVNAVLGCTKILVGISGHSEALVADGIHSLSDLLTDGIVIATARVSTQGADHNHPYGHARIETAVTAALAILVMLVGVGIMADAVANLTLHKEFSQPTTAVIWMACLSIFANEALYHYTCIIGKTLNSNLLRASAWHHRTDALSSVVVLVGVIGAYYGAVYFDALAAIVVSIMILLMSWKLIWASIRELIDTGVPGRTLMQIRQIISDVPGVQSVHQLRTRSMAGNILVDIHLIVSPKISVSEGHYISECVQHTLIENMESISDVIVHIDAEDDEENEVDFIYSSVPDRQTLIAEINQALANIIGKASIEDVVLHYLDGKIDVELTFVLATDASIEKARDLKIRAINIIAENKHINNIDIRFTLKLD